MFVLGANMQQVRTQEQGKQRDAVAAIARGSADRQPPAPPHLPALASPLLLARHLPIPQGALGLLQAAGAAQGPQAAPMAVVGAALQLHPRARRT